MDPRDLRQQLVPEIQEKILIVASDYAIAELGDTFEELGEYFQGLGIAALLANEDQDEFRTNLVRSGHARRYFLRTSAAEQSTSDRFLAVSRTEALWDSLAAGSPNLAAEIAELSIDQWHGDWEYEDDYWYHKLVGNLLLARRRNEPGASGAVQALPRLAAALGDEAEPRYRLCKALLAKDESAFNEALFDLLEHEQRRFDAKRDSIVSAEFPESLFWLKSFVSIEGLALIHLGSLFGITADEHLPLCPEAARLPALSRDVPDLFVDIDNERRQVRGKR
jgi:hypothetical protein